MNGRVTLLFLIAGLHPAWAGDAGTTSANFLKLGVGPRAVGMGEAQVALADDAYATYWNPAGLAQLQTREAALTHTHYVEDIQSQYAAYAHPLASRGTFAGSINFLNVGKFDSFDAQGQPTGRVGAHDSALSLSYAHTLRESRRMGSSFSAGLTGKWIQERLDTVTANAFAMDAGMLYAPGRKWGEAFQGIRVGMALRNIGTAMKFDQQAFTLPRSLTVGASWTGVWMGEVLSLAVDGHQPSDGERSVHAGAELWTLRLFVLRAGYTTRGDLGNGFRIGAGMRFKTVQVDYAFAGAGDFGAIHRAGLSFHFGTTARDPQNVAQDWFAHGMKEFRKRRFSEALVAFNKTLEIDPTHPQALDMMKKTYDELKALTPSE